MTDLEASQMLGVTLATAKRLAAELDVPPNEWCPDDVFAADALLDQLDQENEDEDTDEDGEEDEDDEGDEAAEVDEVEEFDEESE